MVASRLNFLAPLLLVALLPCMPGCMASDLTDDALVRTLRSTNIVKPAAELQASFDDEHKRATIFTEKNPKATDKDCKIDSVLMAKKLMESFPSIAAVLVIYDLQDKSKTQQIDVRKTDVKAFASGLVSAEELLSSLDLTDSQSLDSKSQAKNAGSSGVVPGPMHTQRLILAGRIDELRAKGTGVKPYEDRFNKIESEASSGNTEQLNADMKELSDRLQEQFELLKYAGLPPVHPNRSAESAPDSRTERPSGSRLPPGQADLDRWQTIIQKQKARGKDTRSMEELVSEMQTLLANPSADSMHTYNIDEAKLKQLAKPPFAQRP